MPRPGAGLTFSTPAQEAQALGVLRASARAQSLAQELLEQAGSCRASLLELETRTPGVGGTEGTCPRPWRGARLITTSWLMCNGTAWLCLGHGEAPPWGLQAAGPSSGCPDPKEKGGSSAWRPSGSPRRCLGGSWTVPGAAKGAWTPQSSRGVPAHGTLGHPWVPAPPSCRRHPRPCPCFDAAPLTCVGFLRTPGPGGSFPGGHPGRLVLVTQLDPKCQPPQGGSPQGASLCPRHLPGLAAG